MLSLSGSTTIKRGSDTVFEVGVVHFWCVAIFIAPKGRVTPEKLA